MACCRTDKHVDGYLASRRNGAQRSGCSDPRLLPLVGFICVSSTSTILDVICYRTHTNVYVNSGDSHVSGPLLVSTTASTSHCFGRIQSWLYQFCRGGKKIIHIRKQFRSAFWFGEARPHERHYAYYKKTHITRRGGSPSCLPAPYLLINIFYLHSIHMLKQVLRVW